MTTQHTPEAFVAKWRGNTSTERQVCQQHFLDLCALVGHPTPVQPDPDNKFFTFEAGAAKLSSGQGWADVWFKGHFAVEYKGSRATSSASTRCATLTAVSSTKPRCSTWTATA